MKKKIWEGSGKDTPCHRSLKTVQHVNPTSFLPKSEQYVRNKPCITMMDKGECPISNKNHLIIRGSNEKVNRIRCLASPQNLKS